MFGIFRGIVRFIAFIFWTVLTVPVHAVWYGLTRRMDMPKIWHKGACFIFGVRVRVYGTSAKAVDCPIVYAANHVSYLDIIVLGGFLDVRFVAKKEVAGWPVFGFLSKLQRTVFIDRNRSALDESRRTVRAALTSGDTLMLFPEGTSTDGVTVMPFKAGLFSVLVADATETGGKEPPVKALVQPVAVVLALVDGEPVMGAPQAVRDVYAWHGDMTLAPHLWTLACHRSVDVAVYLLPPLDPAQYTDRRALADDAHDAVAKCLSACHVLPS